MYSTIEGAIDETRGFEASLSINIELRKCTSIPKFYFTKKLLWKKPRNYVITHTNNYIHSCNMREVQLYYLTALHFTTIKPYLVGHNLNKMSKKQVLVGICLLDKLANTRTTKAKSQGANQFNRVVGKWRGCREGNISPSQILCVEMGFYAEISRESM